MAGEHGQVRDTELNAEQEARRRLALAQIRQYPDPVLRMQAREVEEFEGGIGQLVERMRHLLADANGVGLAATQIGVVRRVFVFQREGEEEPTALVNPRLVAHSEELVSEEEGCLSLQTVRVPVERHPTVTLEARTPDGGDLKLELEGLDARVAQHELDHLDGVLIIDRTTPEARREALGALRPQPVLGVRI